MSPQFPGIYFQLVVFLPVLPFPGLAVQVVVRISPVVLIEGRLAFPLLSVLHIFQVVKRDGLVVVLVIEVVPVGPGNLLILSKS